MPLSRNVILNMVAGAWTGLLVLISTPWYVEKLGYAGYGIVAIWVMLQFMMGLLDMGLGASLTKGLASIPLNSGESYLRRDLLRTFEIVYWIIALILTLFLLFFSDWIAQRWINAATLSMNGLICALLLMSLSLGLQFPSALYINGLTGLQAHGYLNFIQIIGSTLRYGAGALVLFWRPDIVWFFGAQVFVAIVQTLAMRALIWYLLYEPKAKSPTFRGDLLRKTSGFSAGMAFTALCAVLLASADRIVLSRMVGSAELGQYAVAFAASGLLQLAIQPFYRTFFPRYNELLATPDLDGLRHEYFHSNRMMAGLLIPVGLVGFVFAPELLLAWLGRHDEKIVTTFRLLVLGITCSGLCWLPAAFQQAYGWTRLHTQMMAGSVFIGVPLIVWTVPSFGIAGATAVWLLHGLSDLTLGLWLMHRRLLKGELLYWYRTVLIPPLVTTGPIIFAAGLLIPPDLGRWTGLIFIAVVGTFAFAFGVVIQQRTFSAGRL